MLQKPTAPELKSLARGAEKAHQLYKCSFYGAATKKKKKKLKQWLNQSPVSIPDLLQRTTLSWWHFHVVYYWDHSFHGQRNICMLIAPADYPHYVRYISKLYDWPTPRLCNQRRAWMNDQPLAGRTWTVKMGSHTNDCRRPWFAWA